MLFKKFKELEIGEIVPSNTTLTLVDSSVTRLLGIVQYVIVHLDGLIFPTDFLVIDMKNDSEGLVILVRPFLATGKAKIDVETCEFILKFNKDKVVFNACQWTPYMEYVEIWYQLKEKGSEVHERMKKKSFHRHEGIPCAWRVLSMRIQAIDEKEALSERQPIIFN